MEKKIDFTIFNREDKPERKMLEKIVSFLQTHLEEYGDPEEDIEKAIKYALSDNTFGGSVIIAQKKDEIIGSVVLNKTGMKGYIPENILVYIAVHNKMRGKGIGKMLMEQAIRKSVGSIALHVEDDNPARFLYEKIGFKKKYSEMRYIR